PLWRLSRLADRVLAWRSNRLIGGRLRRGIQAGKPEGQRSFDTLRMTKGGGCRASASLAVVNDPAAGGAPALQYNSESVGRSRRERRSLRLDDVIAHGVPDHLGERLQFQLPHDRRAVRLNRFHADAERVGDFLVAL